MPSKKNKVSSSKVSKNKKPVKASKPAAKPARAAGGKTVKKPVKPLKASKPVSKKKPEPKKVLKPATKAQKKPIPAKPKAKSTPKKPAKTVKLINKAPQKQVKKSVAVKASIGKPSQAAVSKTKSKPVAQKQKPVKAAIAKKPDSKPKTETLKPVAKEEKVNKNTTKPVEVKASEADKTRKASDPFAKKNYADRSVSDVLAISNTIPVKQKNEISASKIALISNSITNPIKKTDSYAVRPEKEPNGKFELEFVIHSSAEMLYEFLSTPSGLSEWFCDDLNIRNGIYTFIWDDQLQQARLLKTVDVHLVRFQWVDKTDGSYFEFRIQRDDLTNDISLIITDFAESASDRESSKLLWHSQIEKLMHVIGSIF
jgi:uncharacterized protein YndB with AHSA1/START domain